MFGKPKETPTMRDTLDKLQETRELLEKKERVLQKKIDGELQKAKEYSKAKNKRAAIQCLKKKKMYEAQLETLSNFQLRIQDQEVMMEGATATYEVVGVMQTSSQVLKNVQKKMNIDDVDKTMDDINEQTDNIRAIQETLAQPVGIAAEFDDDELLNELEELDALEMDEELMAAPTAQVAAPDGKAEDALPSVPSRTPVAARQPARQAQKDDQDLEALKAEMAM